MKRHLRNVALFLFLGAVVNFVVAWSSTILYVHDDGTFTGYSSLPVRHWPSDVPARWPPPDHTTEKRIVGGIIVSTGAWSNILDAQGGVVEGHGYSISVGEFGWPLAALTVEYWDEFITVSKTKTVVKVSEDHPKANIWREGLVYDDYCLPVKPIWPGFAFNTIFYAAVLWLLLAAPFAYRRHRRIKRGLCPVCAYPVGTWGGQVCTECGRPVQRAR